MRDRVPHGFPYRLVLRNARSGEHHQPLTVRQKDQLGRRRVVRRQTPDEVRKIQCLECPIPVLIDEAEDLSAGRDDSRANVLLRLALRPGSDHVQDGPVRAVQVLRRYRQGSRVVRERAGDKLWLLAAEDEVLAEQCGRCERVGSGTADDLALHERLRQPAAGVRRLPVPGRRPLRTRRAKDSSACS